VLRRMPPAARGRRGAGERGPRAGAARPHTHRAWHPPRRGGAPPGGRPMTTQATTNAPAAAPRHEAAGGAPPPVPFKLRGPPRFSPDGPGERVEVNAWLGGLDHSAARVRAGRARLSAELDALRADFLARDPLA